MRITQIIPVTAAESTTFGIIINHEEHEDHEEKIKRFKRKTKEKEDV